MQESVGQLLIPEPWLLNFKFSILDPQSCA